MIPYTAIELPVDGGRDMKVRLTPKQTVGVWGELK